MGEGKKAVTVRYVLYDTVAEKPHLPSIFFQVWTKYLEMHSSSVIPSKKTRENCGEIPLKPYYYGCIKTKCRN